MPRGQRAPQGTAPGDPRRLAADLEYLQKLGETVKTASRCGLGQTSPNPVLTTLKNFRSEYEKRVAPRGDGLQPSFDLSAAVADAQIIAGRASVHAAR